MIGSKILKNYSGILLPNSINFYQIFFMDAILKIPNVVNEPVFSYKNGSKEREALTAAINHLKSKELKISMIIDGKKVDGEKNIKIVPPHEIGHILGYYSRGNHEHIQMAIEASLKAKTDWVNMPWEKRAAIFLKAADLIAGPYRAKINAATMLGQSKNAYQAEIDSACEMVDFLRFNVGFMQQIYQIQPASSPGIWNYTDYRPLEGFILAITPFNFTAIAGNLPTAPAMMGNTVVWKPSDSQVYSAHVLMEVFMEAGLPPGVINMIFTDPEETSDITLRHKDFAGLHFTGSSSVFQQLWKRIGENIHIYKNYPRIVGETGGKDFILAHSDCEVKALSVALIRGAFEFQGQKCSAASRAYIPKSIWEELEPYLSDSLKEIKMGSVENFENFVNAVINEKAFDRIVSYIEMIKKSPDAEVLFGGGYDKSSGYFIEPTIVLASDPRYATMCEEIFGPVLTIYLYEDDDFEEVVDLLDQTSPYGLTGAIFCQNRKVIEWVSGKLRNAAGNFYINDKPTGAVVGQQPFGGSRASGTNDKAGSMLNLLRWVSPRTVKETFNPPAEYRYPFME